MKPAAFAYHRPQTVSDALGLLAALGDDVKLLAGGQSLGPMMNLRVARPSHLIDINDLSELDSVTVHHDRIEIGSLVRHHRLATDPQIAAACPILSAAATSIGHYAIRQRGTIGGSLAHADPAAQLPLIAILLDAGIRIGSRQGSRTVDAQSFFVSSLVTELAEDEMITAIEFPLVAGRSGWGVEIFSQRQGDFAIVSVAATVGLSATGLVESLRVAVGGAGVVPIRLREIAQPAAGRSADRGWCEEVGNAAAAAVTADDDARVPAAYRRELAATLTARVLAAALQRAEGASVR
ncbi:carbon-monoxide dehydrogenase medium subunit [Nitrobacteraceae bacterium AZCC 2161]